MEDEGIIVTPGAKQALLYAFMVAVQENDEVILLAPCWPTHTEQVELVGEAQFLFAVKGSIIPPQYRQDSRGDYGKDEGPIVINSPNNPTGAVYTPDEMIAIVQLAIEYDLWIISDEIYTEAHLE